MHLIKTVQDQCGRIRPRPRTGRLRVERGEGGVERGGEGSGVGWSGVERSGVEWSGVEWSAVEGVFVK